MIYRELGSTGKLLSGLGFGTNRFAPSDLKDDEGLSKCADLIINGIRKGINYIDCAYTYSMGRAEEIVKRAVATIKHEGLNCYTSTKVMLSDAETESEVRRVVDRSLDAMGLETVTLVFAWQIKTRREFDSIIKPGGLYDGLKKVKDEKIIEHIAFSSHMSPDDTVNVINTGLFDVCMISCNIINVHKFERVLSAAAELNVGIITMNSLGGGVIVGENTLMMRDYLGISPEQSLARTCLRYLYSNHQITTCLSSMQSTHELEENIGAFSDASKPDISVIQLDKMSGFKGYCTKCRYCENCPEKIPISDLMYAYSNHQFTDLMSGYGPHLNNDNIYKNPDFYKAKKLFNARFFDYNGIPDSSENPCVRCGRCEELCTQCLPIIQRLSEIYELADKFHYNYAARKDRLVKLLNNDKYEKVCFFPSGQYTSYLLEDYTRLIGSFPFKILISDNACVQEYINDDNHKVIPVTGLLVERPDLILVVSYTYGDEIYDKLIHDNRLLNAGIKIAKLHQIDDVQWY